MTYNIISYHIEVVKVEKIKKGDIVGVKGRIQADSFEKDGEKKHITKIIAEKLTFLSSKAKEEVEPAR